jgi:hypothetical protein
MFPPALAALVLRSFERASTPWVDPDEPAH